MGKDPTPEPSGVAATPRGSFPLSSPAARVVKVLPGGGQGG